MSNSSIEMDECLPDKNLSVLAFLAFKLPAVASTNRLMRAEKFVSDSAPNINTLDDMADLSVPPKHIVGAIQKLAKTSAVKSILCPHEPGSGGRRYHPKLAAYWARITSIRDTQSKWQRALDNIRSRITRNPTSSLLNDVYGTLSWLPWTGDLLRNTYNNSIERSELSAFLTTEWLSDDHELLMLDLVKDDLAQAGQEHTLVENTAFTLLLAAAYHDRQNYSTSKHYAWLRQKADLLSSGAKTILATISNKDNSHCVSIVVNSQTRQVLFADPLGNPVPQALRRNLDWWISYHNDGDIFNYTSLPISLQVDSYSCGVLAWDAVRCFLLEGFTLVEAHAALDERLRIYLRLVSVERVRELLSN